MTKQFLIRTFVPAVILTCLLLAFESAAQEAPQLNFQQGPATFPIGGGLAEIDLSEKYLFLDRDNTVGLLRLTENPTSGSERGTVLPTNDAESWFVIFEFDNIGYVPDADDDLDADALLASIREGTEVSNATRRENGWSEMQIVGWHDAPRYDPTTKNLTWAIIGASNDSQTINRIVKVLGRRGVMTLTLVASSEELASADRQLEALIDHYRFQTGNTYAEYLPGTDKLAEVGLAALVVGGAGAALVKSGILARFWKVILIGLAGAGAAIKRLFTGTRAEDEPITRA
jgi:uncharacterized membrane-anchored protein